MQTSDIIEQRKSQPAKISNIPKSFWKRRTVLIVCPDFLFSSSRENLHIYLLWTRVMNVTFIVKHPCILYMLDTSYIAQMSKRITKDVEINCKKPKKPRISLVFGIWENSSKFTLISYNSILFSSALHIHCRTFCVCICRRVDRTYIVQYISM